MVLSTHTLLTRLLQGVMNGVKMQVQHVHINTLYGGDRIEELCYNCSNKSQSIVDANAEIVFYPIFCHQRGDWHNGNCKYCNDIKQPT
jgi:hypothetical protein